MLFSATMKLDFLLVNQVYEHFSATASGYEKSFRLVTILSPTE